MPNNRKLKLSGLVSLTINGQSITNDDLEIDMTEDDKEIIFNEVTIYHDQEGHGFAEIEIELSGSLTDESSEHIEDIYINQYEEINLLNLKDDVININYASIYLREYWDEKLKELEDVSFNIYKDEEITLLEEDIVIDHDYGNILEVDVDILAEVISNEFGNIPLDITDTLYIEIPHPGEQEPAQPTEPTFSESEVYIGDNLYIYLNLDRSDLYHNIYYNFSNSIGLIANDVYDDYLWKLPEDLNNLIPFKQEGIMEIVVETYDNLGELIGKRSGYITVKRTYIPEPFPTPEFDDKIIIYDKFDPYFERPLAILDTVTDVTIKETLNAEFTLDMNVSHNEKSECIKVDNYVEVLGDIFKIKKIDRSRSKNKIDLKVECEHVYFELLDDYIEQEDRRTFYPHELADYINKFTSFNVNVDDYIKDNPDLFPSKRITISRGSPIKTINRMLDYWGLDLHRFRRNVTVKSRMNEDKIQLFKHQKNLTSFNRSDDSGKLTTRLYLIGREGLSIEGLKVSEIELTTETNGGITTIFSNDGAVLGTVKTSNGVIVSKYIDSKYIDSYPVPRKGELLDSEILDKHSLLLRGLEEINTLDSTNDTFTLSVTELKNIYGDIEKFGLGYTAIIQDENLLRDYEGGLVEARITEYTYHPFEPNKDSTVVAGIHKNNALDFFKDLNEIREAVEKDLNEIREAVENMECNGGGGGEPGSNLEDYIKIGKDNYRFYNNQGEVADDGHHLEIDKSVRLDRIVTEDMSSGSWTDSDGSTGHGNHFHGYTNFYTDVDFNDGLSVHSRDGIGMHYTPSGGASWSLSAEYVYYWLVQYGFISDENIPIIHRNSQSAITQGTDEQVASYNDNIKEDNDVPSMEEFKNLPQDEKDELLYSLLIESNLKKS